MPNGGLRTSMSFRLSAGGPLRTAFIPAAGLFSPGLPLTPPDPQPVRAFDFDVGANTVTTPRAPAAFGFAELRAFANVETVRLAIETAKDQIERLDWRIKPRDARSAQPADAARIAQIQAFFAKPDGITPFATWLRALLEDMLVLDAPAVEKRRDRSGRLIGLDVVPGDTIKLLVDETGRRPTAPLPAFQQIIRGMVWADLTTDDLIYAPRNPRPNHLYGFSPVEQIIVTLNTILRRQTAQLGYFTESNVPSGLLNVPAGWGPDAIRTMQDAWDARLQGDNANKSKVQWVPAETKYQPFKDSPLKDDFDEWLARIVCYAFSLPPSPFIKQMNRSTAQTDQDRSESEGPQQRKLWWKRIADDLITAEFGAPDLEWGWADAADVDPLVAAQIEDLNLKNGSAVINEVRDRRGLGPVPGGDVARIYTATGASVLPSPSMGEGPGMGVAAAPDLAG
ncbi:MAG: phage portal protein [Caulobacteraceae bacterium]